MAIYCDIVNFDVVVRSTANYSLGLVSGPPLAKIMTDSYEQTHLFRVFSCNILYLLKNLTAKYLSIWIRIELAIILSTVGGP